MLRFFTSLRSVQNDIVILLGVLNIFEIELIRKLDWLLLIGNLAFHDKGGNPSEKLRVLT